MSQEALPAHSNTLSALAELLTLDRPLRIGLRCAGSEEEVVLWLDLREIRSRGDAFDVVLRLPDDRKDEPSIEPEETAIGAIV
jgi:hypothetical protein